MPHWLQNATWSIVTFGTNYSQFRYVYLFEKFHIFFRSWSHTSCWIGLHAAYVSWLNLRSKVLQKISPNRLPSVRISWFCLIKDISAKTKTEAGNTGVQFSTEIFYRKQDTPGRLYVTAYEGLSCSCSMMRVGLRAPTIYTQRRRRWRILAHACIASALMTRETTRTEYQFARRRRRCRWSSAKDAEIVTTCVIKPARMRNKHSQTTYSAAVNQLEFGSAVARGSRWCAAISLLEACTRSISYHLDSSDLPGYGNTSDRCSATGGRQIVLATNRNGRMLRLNATPHDDDDDDVTHNITPRAMALPNPRWWLIAALYVAA